MQRAEGQFRRDLTLPFALWNLCFRTTINIGHNMFAVKNAVSSALNYTATDFRNAAENICQCLAGKYTASGGRKLNVNGDLRKLRAGLQLTPALSSLSKQMLSSLRATCRKIEGTQETRGIMRQELKAYQVAKGKPMMITVSPSERHNLLMIRLSRVRASDPLSRKRMSGTVSTQTGTATITGIDTAFTSEFSAGGTIDIDKVGKFSVQSITSDYSLTLTDSVKSSAVDVNVYTTSDCAKWGGRDSPALIENHEVGAISIDSLLGQLPPSDERRAILAKDPLASVYGFRMLMKLTLSTLFGVRVCSNCPNCNLKPGGCVDAYGSVATAEGGIIGRTDAYYISIENQKEDDLHGHGLFWPQCVFRQQALVEIAETLQNEHSDLFEQCKWFKTHTCNEQYYDVADFESQRDELEDEWPEYARSARLSVQPDMKPNTEEQHVLSQHADNSALFQHASAWRHRFRTAEQQIQMRVNHHIHPKDDEGIYRPMKYCAMKENPDKCKFGNPKELLEDCVTVCPGVAKKLQLPTSGNRNALGSLVGPVNHSMLTGSQPALHVCVKTNTHVMIPYRMPLLKQTHSKSICELDDCVKSGQGFRDVLKLQERIVHNCIGYITDYATKRQPFAVNEINKFVDGHHDLQKKLNQDGVSTSRAAVRHTQRLMSDLLGRGTARKAVEVTNLIVNRRPQDVTHAESMKSHLLVPFPCSDYLRCARNECDTISDGSPDAEHHHGMQIDSRNPGALQLSVRASPPELYGHRGPQNLVAYLSPHEFHSNWEVQRVAYPTKAIGIAEEEDAASGNVVFCSNETYYHARITEAGAIKLASESALVAGEDYIVRGEQGKTKGCEWFAFPFGCPFRDDYVMVMRHKPAIPRFDGSVLKHGGSTEDHARHMITYLRPWTLSRQVADEHCPHIKDLVGADGSWYSGWVQWLERGVLSEQSKHVILNFQSVYCMRQHEVVCDGSTEKDASRLSFTKQDLKQVIQTQRRKSKQDTSNDMINRRDASFEFVTKVWSSKSGCKPSEQNLQLKAVSIPADLKGLLRRVKSDRNKALRKTKLTDSPPPQDSTSNVSVSLSHISHRQVVEAWVDDLTKSKAKHGLKCKNKQQEAVVHMIARRVLQEIDDSYADGNSEPTRALVCGRPGVGKSFTIKAATKLFDKLGYKHGVHYAFTSLQAVVAAQLDGDTMHKLFGLNIYGKSSSSLDSASRLSQMRWLFIDEISQVTAEFLAQAEAEARLLKQDVGTYRLKPDKTVRAWGGLNVIYTGDFLQLPPPGKGSSLTTIPDDILPRLHPKNSTVIQGLNLMWCVHTALHHAQSLQPRFLQFVQPLIVRCVCQA
jgi:hypothetical protein